jgi:hypothetical protein
LRQAFQDLNSVLLQAMELLLVGHADLLAGRNTPVPILHPPPHLP